MKVYIRRLISYITTNFWFIPGLMALIGIVLGYLAQKLDLYVYNSLNWTLTDAAGARAILTTVAASSITVAGVVFSITMVVLSSASSQFGPRLMRNFIRHNETKYVLGGYIGIFIYCMMVLATVRDGSMGWVPQISVTLGGVLGLLSFGLLISFIQHVTSFLQAPKIINEVAQEVKRCSSEIFPLNALAKDTSYTTTVGQLPDVKEHSIAIISSKDGYLQTINLSNILNLTIKHNAIVRYHFRPGEYLLHGETLATVWNDDEAWDSFEKDILASVTTGCERTELQDIEYAIDQLVEVAVRAMSKGINDPYTAINCIHRLSSALALIAEETLPGGLIHDENGKLRIAAVTYSYAGLIDAAFHQIRQNAKVIESVSIELMKSLVKLSQKDAPSSFLTAIHRHADLLLSDCKSGFHNASDYQELKASYQQLKPLAA